MLPLLLHYGSFNYGQQDSEWHSVDQTMQGLYKGSRATTRAAVMLAKFKQTPTSTTAN